MKKSEILAQELDGLITEQKAETDKIKNDTAAWSKYWNYKGFKAVSRQEELKRLIDIEKRREIEVGDGATIHLYSDSWACTVIAKTKATITLQRDTAILDPDFKPDFIIGGFSAHCTNNADQTYTYERDPTGSTYKAFWSEKAGRYNWQGEAPVTNGRHERYDYNF